jgi:Xaa-Pro aminopeptidase
MTDNPREALTFAVSDQELERRWDEVRGRMKEDGIATLIMQDTNEWNGGYVKWFTDIPARTGSPMTVIFPVDDLMTTITAGGKPPGDLGPPAWTMRGVKDRLTAPFFPSIRYRTTLDAELAVEALKKKPEGRIGIVGEGRMAHTFCKHLFDHMPGATFVDATDLVDEIKAIKSPEEIDLIKKTAVLQDEAMEYARSVIKPGRKVSEIVADVVHKVTLLGSEEQLIMAGCGPVGKPAPMQKRHFQGRTLRENEQFTLMIEVNGPGGMYTELGRLFFTGVVPAEIFDAYELCREAQKITLNLLKPGAHPADILQANNEFLIKQGYLPETRLYAHGQGYDLVERPAILDDEPMTLKANMNMTIHPTIGSDRVWVWVCDNYLITESGVGPCLHKTPQKIFAV